MYKKTIPHKDFNDKPRNTVACFNLTMPEIVKLMEQLQVIAKFLQAAEQEEQRILEPEEIIPFYTAFEEVLLESWGEPSEDGQYFRKDHKYDFKDSAVFPAVMTMFVTDPAELVKFINEVVPGDMQEVIKNTDVKLKNFEEAPETPEALKAEIARLRSQVSDSVAVASEGTAATS